MLRSFAGALGATLLVLPSFALAQDRTVTGRIWVAEDTHAVHLTVHRSETWALEFPVGNPWERIVRLSAGQQVEATLRVTSQGQFGGTALVTGLAKDVKGRVVAAMDGGPVTIAVSKSEGYRISGAFEGYLLRRADQEVEVRLRVTQPGMFGARAEVVHVYRDIQGQVFAAMDGGPVHISANKSNVFQVMNAPFEGLVLGQEGQRVSVRARLIEPGMFGGRIEVIHMDGRTSKGRQLKLEQEHGLVSVGYVPKGAFVRVTGVSSRYPSQLEVELEDGRRGLLPRNAVGLTLPTPLHGLTSALEPQ